MNRICAGRGDVWAQITQLAKKSKRADVAVAWCSSGLNRLLPLSKGSLLVTNLSEECVKAGQTKPSELLPLARRGVAIHSNARLHAKVFVFDKVAVVGSTNVSTTSERGLTEAVLITDDAATVKSARAFVQSLRGDRVGEEELRSLQKLYRPPRWGKGGRQPTGKRLPREPIRAALPPVWVVKLDRVEWDSETEKQDKTSRPRARKAMESKSNHLDSFSWDGNGGLRRNLQRHEVILQVVDEGSVSMVTPPGRTVLVKRWGGNEPRLLAYVEEPRATRRRALPRFLKSLGPFSKEFKRIGRQRRVTNQAFIRRLLQAWPD